MACRLICALLFAATIAVAVADEPEKLIGGEDVDILLHPYVASIKWGGEHLCGGAIVGESHIVTAAHCVQPFVNTPGAYQKMTVVTGSSSLRFGGKTRAIKKMIHHWSYVDDSSRGFDVAVLQLTEPIKFTARQKPIDLPTSDVPIGVDATVVAWGATSHPRGRLSSNLQKLDVLTIPSKECQEFHRQRVSTFEFCTILDVGYGTCEGDSGSPVVYDGKLIGVVSSGIPCALGIPDIQTDIYKVRDFIDVVMKQ